MLLRFFFLILKEKVLWNFKSISSKKIKIWVPRNFLRVYGTLQPGMLLPRWNERIHILAHDMILFRYLIWGRGHVCVFFHRMLQEHASSHSDWWDMLMLGQRTMLTCELAEFPDNEDRKAVLDISSWSQIGQAALLQTFRPCGTKNMETGNCLQKLNQKEKLWWLFSFL